MIHGTISCYTGSRCRCSECREAMRLYDKARSLRAHREGPLLVPALGAHRRLHALRAIGWPLSEIAAMLGRTDPGSLSHILSLSRPSVTRALHDRVESLYDELSTTPGPSLSVAMRAHAGGHAPPAAWDDDQIDSPSGRPHGVRTGDLPGALAERVNAAAEMRREGATLEEIASTLGVSRSTARRWTLVASPTSLRDAALTHSGSTPEAQTGHSAGGTS